MHLHLKRNKVWWHVVVMGGNGEPVFTSETYYSKGNGVRALHKASLALKLPIK